MAASGGGVRAQIRQGREWLGPVKNWIPQIRAGLAQVRAGELSPGATRALVRWVYGLWLLALLGKALGSAWDVSWHFKWLRDDFAPPHLINLAGDGLMILLVLFHSYTRFAVDTAALRLMQIGTVMFILAAPVDVINHQINGLDITSWSITHGLLYLGTAIAIAGAIRGCHGHGVGIPGRAFVLGTMWFFFLENVLFPNQQQEYGVLAIANYAKGTPTAEPILLDLAEQQLGVQTLSIESFTGFALPIPNWVYLVWITAAAGLVLMLARRMVGARFTATTIAAAYLVWRAVLGPIFVAIGFPGSAIPWLLLGAGLAVDLVFLLAAKSWPVQAVAAGVLVTGFVYGFAWLQDRVTDLPPVSWASAPWAGLTLAAVWAAVNLFLDWRASVARTASTPKATPVPA